MLLEAKEVISKTVSNWFEEKSKEQSQQGNNSLIATPEGNDELFNLVQDKMKKMETEILLERIKALEKVAQHLVFELRKNSEENRMLREIALHTSTNVEVILNQLYGMDSISEEYNDDDLGSGSFSSLSDKGKKLRIN